MRLVQPVADRGVRWLARANVDPRVVVLTHTALGLMAAALLSTAWWAAWVLAGVLLLGKTLLDNMDGGLARATGRVTEMGRYLDTVMDLIVNVTLFAALARHGPTAVAVVGWIVLTLLLSLDYQLERRYRALRVPAREPDAPGRPAWVLALLRTTYAILLGPQDRALAQLDRAAFQRIAGVPEDRAPLDARLAWSDLFSTASIVNLGLTTQLVLLSVCAFIGQPFWYVWSIFVQLAYVLGAQLVRGARFRRYLHGERTSA